MSARADLEGLAFSPSGELFASTISSSKIFRYLIDPSTGEAIPHGTIANPGSTDLHHLAFSQNGDLYVASQFDDRVYTFSFNSSGNAVLDGSISVVHAAGLAMSPSGELLVTSHGNGIGKITSFLPGGDGNYAFNWSIPSDAASDSLVAIAIEPTPTTHLVVTVQPPGSVTAGSFFGFTVTAEDSSGNVDISFNGTVTVSLASDPSVGTLDGTVTATAQNGAATFSDLILKEAGSGYTLLVTASGLASTTTSTFDVTPTPTPTPSPIPAPTPIPIPIPTPVGPIGGTAATRTVLTAQPRPANLGRPVTLTATVKDLKRGGPTPSGFVTFMDGTAGLGTVALRRGVVRLKTSSLPLGPDSIRAEYAPSAGFAPSTAVIVEDVRAHRSRSKAAPAAETRRRAVTSASMAIRVGEETATLDYPVAIRSWHYFRS